MYSYSIGIFYSERITNSPSAPENRPGPGSISSAGSCHLLVWSGLPPHADRASEAATSRIAANFTSIVRLKCYQCAESADGDVFGLNGGDIGLVDADDSKKFGTEIGYRLCRGETVESALAPRSALILGFGIIGADSAAAQVRHVKVVAEFDVPEFLVVASRGFEIFARIAAAQAGAERCLDRGGKAITGLLAGRRGIPVARREGNFGAVKFAAVACRDIPFIAVDPRGRELGAGECRAVVANPVVAAEAVLVLNISPTVTPDVVPWVPERRNAKALPRPE